VSAGEREGESESAILLNYRKQRATRTIGCTMTRFDMMDKRSRRARERGVEKEEREGGARCWSKSKSVVERPKDVALLVL
jgi:hypothetical protein